MTVFFWWILAVVSQRPLIIPGFVRSTKKFTSGRVSVCSWFWVYIIYHLLKGAFNTHSGVWWELSALDILSQEFLQVIEQSMQLKGIIVLEVKPNNLCICLKKTMFKHLSLRGKIYQTVPVYIQSSSSRVEAINPAAWICQWQENNPSCRINWRNSWKRRVKSVL